MHVIRAAALGLLLSLPAWGQTALVTNNPPYSIQAGDTPGFYVEAGQRDGKAAEHQDDVPGTWIGGKPWRKHRLAPI